MQNRSPERPVRVGVISLGCAKNLVDAEIMLGSLMKGGMEITNDATQADVVIVNTCSFIDAAQEESVDTILQSAEVREALHCPECGSSEIEYPQYNRKFKLEPAVVAMLAKVGLVEKRFYCRHCQFMWPLSEKVEGPRDILGWPRKKTTHSEGEPTRTTSANS